MRIIELHDNLNPTQLVVLDADEVSGVGPFGSGSVVQCGGVAYGVYETPTEVEALLIPPTK
jgi:hypothetical protein